MMGKHPASLCHRPALTDSTANLPDSRFKRYESLQAALNLIDQGFTLIDSNLGLVAWNSTFLRLLDFPAEMAYVGAPFESFIRFNALRGDYGSGDPQAYIDARMAAARAFTEHQIERTRPDGTVLLVRGLPVPEHGFVTLYSDISDQRQAQAQILKQNQTLETHVAERTAELRRSEAQMRLITDSIPALIAYSDRDRVYRYINRGYQDWFGLDPAAPGKVSAKEFLGADTFAGIRPHVTRAFAGAASTFEYEIQRIDGSRVTARTTLIPEISANGSVAGCFELTFDISAEKRAQDLLIQARKMEALGQLTGGLAHDFNNILTVIIGNLSVLDEASGGKQAVADFVKPALDAARRGAGLIKALQSFSRRQPLQARAVDIVPLLEADIGLLRSSLPENLQIELTAAATPLWAWVDADQLQQALLNLIFNARDASPAAGRISLCASAALLDGAQAADRQLTPGPYICIEVSDQGSGMEPQTLARVFEPFFTTKRPGLGTGLGLAMVHDFIQQSGGAIAIKSRQGQGTEVALWLPACAAEAEQPLLAAAAGTSSASRGLALLVEDEAEVRKVVRRMLRELGFAVIEAGSGSEAMQILEQTPGIALLLSDMVMPGEVDGRALAAYARDQIGLQQILLMSGYAPEQPEEQGQGSLVPILSKPFTRAQLAAMLEEISS
jgi:signal transduction histidine kinase